MYKDSLKTLNAMALKKKELLDNHLLRYLLASALAGAYVGLGIVLIFRIGAPLFEISSPVTMMVMGLCFGIALTLVIFAGAELFTGNNMIFTVSTLSGVTTWRDTFRNWGWCYLGNLLGAMGLCILVVGTGLFSGIGSEHLLMRLASDKMNAGYSELFFRGILANWLVCLAIWTAIRVKSDVAKLLLISMMLFAFVASGYEHSIANMTVFGLALMLPGTESITLVGGIQNLFFVTIGNVIGGAVFLGMVYWAIDPQKEVEHKTAATSPLKRANEPLNKPAVTSARSQ